MNIVKLPGFLDVHVHFREPGFSYKETIATGTEAAAAGGYTDVCAMPNLNPVPDTRAHLAEELHAIEKNAKIRVYPYGAITMGERGEALADMEALSPYVIAFSDDGKGVQNEALMREAMERAKALGKMIVAHCEDNTLLFGGVIHDGAYAKANGFPGISSESEWRPIERDLKLAKETGVSYHVCHVSAKESVALIRKAKQEGVNVTCETAPHYLVFTDEELEDDGKWKMNPPIRSAEDRDALVEGVLDGTIDMLVTDHAPHSREEKAKGLLGSAFGIVGLETAFPVLYTKLVKTGIVPMERIIEMMTAAPRRRFGIPEDPEDYALWDLDAQYTVDPEKFRTKGRATPFEGMELFGKCLKTVMHGRTVWQSGQI